MLTVSNFHYERFDREFFRGLSFSVNPGEILQITGANGVGKTTLLRLLAGFLPIAKKEAIQCSVLRSYIGHEPALTAALTAKENLQFIAKLYAADFNSIPGLLEQFALSACADVFAGKLSAGQRRRLAFAGLSLMNTKLWLLDEPFTALDQSAIKLIQTLLKKHVAAGGAVILTTHHAIDWNNDIRLKQLHLGENN